jgi:uncharacterized protein
MQTKYPLSKYEEMYKGFDAGHNQKHMESVRTFAVKLAEKYCPEKIEIAYVAATLHDIGLSVSREGHELEGYKILKEDEELKEIYGEEDFKEILEAVKEHRASTGNPQTTISKIVSDADKVSDTTESSFQRAYDYGLEKYPELNHEEQIIRAAEHLSEKFGGNGTGTRVYFEESRLRLEEIFKPIIEANINKDYQELEKLLN